MQDAVKKYLVIDQGNTLTKAAMYIDDEIHWLNTFRVFDQKVANNIGFESEDVTGGIISSVSTDPKYISSLLPDVDWLILDHNTPVPVRNLYYTPETLGKDRLAGVVAASIRYPQQDVLVIDAGTAITYDLITKDQDYFGGSISPGLSIRFKGLHTFTERLPLYEAAIFKELTGRDTYESIMSGVMTGTLLEMEGFISEYQKKYPGLITVLTGGDAIYFDKMLKSNIFALPNLVIDGLKLILQYNLEK